MKKTLLLYLCFVLSCGLLNAQFGSSNQQLINGSLIFSPNSSKSQPNFSNQQNNLFLGLGFGYGRFNKKNILTFFSLGYNYSNFKNLDNNQEESNIVTGKQIGRAHV